MAIYCYKCEKCDHEFELHQKHTDPQPKACPKCGGGPVEKQIAPFSFQLRGGGWFKDGYRGGKKK